MDACMSMAESYSLHKPLVRTEGPQRGRRGPSGRMTWASLVILYPCPLASKQPGKKISSIFFLCRIQAIALLV